MSEFSASDAEEVIAASYKKSATANSPIAPTNEATVEKAQARYSNPVLDEDEFNFVTIVNYHFSLDGDLPSPAFLEEEYGFAVATSEGYYNDPKIIESLESYNIDVTPTKKAKVLGQKPPPKAPKLTAEQIVVANILLDLADNRSIKKKLQDNGISTSKYAAWRKDPEFNKFLQDSMESMVGNSQHEAMMALLDKVNSGDIKAIAYYHELTGRYVQASAKAGAQSGPDLQQMVVRIVEIVIDEADPETAQRIAARLKGLVAGGQVAGILSEPEIPQPEIAEARELTPEVKQLMNKGLGYD